MRLCRCSSIIFALAATRADAAARRASRFWIRQVAYLQLAHGGRDGRGSEALIFPLRSVQEAIAVLALHSAADGNGPISAQLPTVQLEEAFAQVLAAGSGQAAFPGDVFGFGGAELVVCGWLRGGAVRGTRGWFCRLRGRGRGFGGVGGCL